MDQKSLIAAALVLSAFSGIISIPVVSRIEADKVVASVVTIFMLMTLMGGFDITRPVFVREFSQGTARIKILEPLVISAAWSSISSVFVALVLFISFGHFFELKLVITLSIGCFFYFISSPFVSTLEARGSVGTAYFTRSLTLSLFYLGSASLAIFNRPLFEYSLLFSACLLAQLALAFRLSRTLWKFSWERGQSSVQNIAFTAQANFAKIFVDFSDRFILARLLPSQMFAAYTLFFEFSAKANTITQALNSYIYPKLCKRSGRNIFRGSEILFLTPTFFFL